MKKYIITGAAVGIGFQISLDLLQKGHFVILNDSDSEALLKKSQQFKDQGIKNFSILIKDASHPEFLEEAMDLVAQTPGELMGIVANAGITTFGDFWNYSRDSMRRILEVNIQGTFFFIQRVANYFRTHSIPGSIVIITSVTGHQAHPDLAVYGMTKAALSQLVQNLVIDLSPFRIRINAVSPGATLTERTISDKKYKKIWSEITPLKKPATVHDISQAVHFFLSDQSSHITGQTLIVDGGWTSISPAPIS